MRHRLFVGVLVLELVPVACGSGSERVDVDGAPASDGAQADGAPVGDGPGSSSDDRLYPIEVGRSWMYDVTSTYPSCPGGTRGMRVISAGTTEGRPTFQVMGFCGLTGHTSVAGDRVEDYYDWGPTGWMRALDEPVVAGHTWTTTNGSATFTMTYSDAGTVGDYADCWRVTQNVSYTSYWVYCRGVGLVRYEIVDLAGGTIRAELRGKNF